MREVKVLLADDHAMLRSGLRSLIGGTTGMTVVGEAVDGDSAVRLSGELEPDVVVMDLLMPGLSGVDATRHILATQPGVRVVCLTAQSTERAIGSALAAGATGFVRKESAFEELADAVRGAMGGQTYVSPSLADVAARSQDDAAPGGRAPAKLSGREREVLQLLADGMATKEAAHALKVSVKTVETHRANLMNKLNLFSVAELTKYAVREGMSAL